MTTRIKWIDNAKGLLMILVVLGHSGINAGMNKYILAFHMFAFFMISGMLYNKDKYDEYSAKDFCFKKFKELILPYFYFESITIIISFIIKIIVYKQLIDFKDDILSIILCLNLNNGDMIEMILWFLPSIFVTEVMFFFMNKSKTFMKNLPMIIIILSFLGYYESRLITHIVPFTLDISITGVVFYSIGFILRDYILKYYEIKFNITRCLVTLVCLLIFILSSYNNSIIYMYINQYGNYFLTYCSAFTGIFIFLVFAVIFPKTNFIEFIGKNTLLVFVIHLKLLYFISKIVNKIIGLNHGYVINEFIIPIIDTSLILITLIPIIKIINYKFPFLIGKNKLIIN